jgi:D-serine deaminase-like pyridoxal phosphate-dependent protein
MSKDTGPIPGHGFVVSPTRLDGWKLGRVSQEHGILTRKPDVAGSSAPGVGEVIRVVGQHACMVLSNHPWYYIVENGGDTVIDVWVPWKGW